MSDMKEEKAMAAESSESQAVNLNGNFLFDQVNKEKKKAMQKRIDEEWVPGNLKFPEFWKKRKARMNPKLLKELEETASRKPVACDEFGFYAPGIYLHRCFVVETKCDDGVWSLHVFGEQPITTAIIQEVRFKYLPDDCVMAQLWPSRSEQRALKGVVLYEVPGEVIRK